MVQSMRRALALLLLCCMLTGCSASEDFYKETVRPKSEPQVQTYEPTPAQYSRFYNISYEKFLWKPTSDFVLTVTCPKFFTPFKYSAESTTNKVTSRQVVASNQHEGLLDDKGLQKYAYHNYILDYVERDDYKSYCKNYLQAEVQEATEKDVSMYFPKSKMSVSQFYLTGTLSTVRGIEYKHYVKFSENGETYQLPYYSVHFPLPNSDWIVLSVHNVVPNREFENVKAWVAALEKEGKGLSQLEKSVKTVADNPINYTDMINDFLCATVIGDYSKDYTPISMEVEIPTLETNTEETTEETTTEEANTIGVGVIDTVEDVEVDDDDYDYDPNEVYFFE